MYALGGDLIWPYKEASWMARTRNHNMDCSEIDIFEQELGVEGREEHHRRHPFLIKDWIIGHYFGCYLC